MTKIAFIGLGNMGSGMAANQAKAGHEVRAFDLSEEALKRAAIAGCKPATSLAEALEAAKRAGLDGRLLFETLMKGSADSFALRNHGMKAMLVEAFPERAFSTQYARKDLGYALDLARSVDVRMEGAELADRLLNAAVDQGFGDLYWPVVSRVIASRHQTEPGAA